MQTTLNDLTVVFLSILLEALPFVLLGSLIASAISLFVSDALLFRFIPKNRIAGLFTASLLGIIFPVCDCTVVPVIRRLVRKGLPPSLAVTFMCAVPIVNPAVIASTSWAFAAQPRMIWLRMIVGVSSAVAAGLAVGKLTRESDPLLADRNPAVHTHDGCPCEHDHGGTESGEGKASSRVQHFLTHATAEFVNNAALISLGALLSAVIQILVPRTIMYPVGASPAASVAVMMGFTWLLSLCSNADAFVAKSFYGLFTAGSVMAFMTFGQMIDLKNTVMMLGFFKKRFIVITTIVIAAACFSWGLAINILGIAR